MDKVSNIVIFMVDQLSAKWLVLAEERSICDLPNVRRLREMGTSFTNAFTPNPVCSPARATLVTGLTTRQHGVLQNGYMLDANIPTFMRLLQENGWHTGGFGKMHFKPHFSGVTQKFYEYGLHTTYITEDPRAGEWMDWVEKTHPEYYTAAQATCWAVNIPEIKAYGPDKRNLSAEIQRARATFDWSHPLIPSDGSLHYVLPFPEAVSQTAWITGHALDYIQSIKEPSCAFVSYVQPHAPFSAPEDYFARVNRGAIPEPVTCEWAEDSNHPRSFDLGIKVYKIPPATWRDSRHCYFADIVHLDEQLGKVLDALEEKGFFESTLFIFLSDHGDLLFDHGFRGKENRHYDACIRIPLIVAGPGFDPGSTNDAFVTLLDIAPTILRATSITYPEPPVGPYLTKEDPGTLPGTPLQDVSPETHKHAYIESYNIITDAEMHHWARTIRNAHYRYTWYAQGSGEQLFDLQADPDETVNLVYQAEMASVIREMRDNLLEEVIAQDFPHTPRSLFAHGVH